MRFKHTTLSFAILVALLFLFGAKTYADVSQAAALFLRIAPGARPGAMGETFVAIADDATATYWNPAGLGAAPLADTWLDFKVPVDLRPLSAVAVTKTGHGPGHLGYEIWAITAQGLARYDYKKWHLSEEFGTRTDQTVEMIVRSFIKIPKGTDIEPILKLVADHNNIRPFEDLTKIRDAVIQAAPQDYSIYESLVAGFDSLLDGYIECRVNWRYVAETEELLKKGMKDSLLSEMEMDRINFAVEKSRNRFIPEDLRIPYSATVLGELTSIVGTDRILAVGTKNGLVTFDGKKWRRFTTEEGLPSNNITCLGKGGSNIYVGTDRGPATFQGASAVPFASVDPLPQGIVTAIGAASGKVWFVSNNDLYYFDRSNVWNSIDYTVTLDDTPGTIASRFAIYDTEEEKEAFIAKFKKLNPAAFEAPAILEQKSDGNGAESTDTTGKNTGSESDATVDAVEPIDKSPVVSDLGSFKPGDVIKVPLTAGFKGEVNTIEVNLDGSLWVGTSYGILRFADNRWQMFGYETRVIKEQDTFDGIVDRVKHDSDEDRAAYKARLMDINDMSEGTVEVGDVIRIYANPASSDVRSIATRNDVVYFATGDGVITFDDGNWSRVDVKGMGHAQAIGVAVPGSGLWLASSDKVVFKSKGRRDISGMHVKWLPGLADDVYYEFLSFTNPVEGWGTVGGNITFITYGSQERTETDPTPLGSFSSFELAFSGSYGTSLTTKLKGGVTLKGIYSRLSPFGAGIEKGDGTTWGFAADFGLLYILNPRLNLGMAVTNIGPDLSYSDVKPQSDPLPRNLAVGFAYRLLNSDFYRMIVTGEVNKMLVGLNGGLRNEVDQTLKGVGTEFVYANLIAIRAGYKQDGEDTNNSITTFGVGLSFANRVKFDFSYIPSGSTSDAQKNTLRVSFSVAP